MEIRIEANGKWSRDQAISNIEKLKRFNISGVEQPVHRDDIEGLQNIRAVTGMPVIVDESICTLSDAKHLIENEACDIINIKISKCGGLLRSKRIADFARSRNVLCQVGAHVGETDILNKAGEYFAMTIPNLFYFEAFASLLFENGWEKGNIKKGDQGKLNFSNFGFKGDLTDQSLKLLCSLTP
jgi:muconate cycloisomerase